LSYLSFSSLFKISICSIIESDLSISLQRQQFKYSFTLLSISFMISFKYSYLFLANPINSEMRISKNIASSPGMLLYRGTEKSLPPNPPDDQPAYRRSFCLSSVKWSFKFIGCVAKQARMVLKYWLSFMGNCFFTKTESSSSKGIVLESINTLCSC